MTLSIFLAVFIGGGVGALGRHLMTLGVVGILGDRFPWGILLVNVLGSFLIGLTFVLIEPGEAFEMSLTWRQFIIVGVLGGFTTFSSFSLQTWRLAEGGMWLAAALNVAANVVMCLVSVTLGAWFARTLNAYL